MADERLGFTLDGTIYPYALSILVTAVVAFAISFVLVKLLRFILYGLLYLEDFYS